MKTKSKPFTDATMREPTHGKPHIAFRQGYWRTSMWTRKNGALYVEAHKFINRLNHLIHQPKEN